MKRRTFLLTLPATAFANANADIVPSSALSISDYAYSARKGSSVYITSWQPSVGLSSIADLHRRLSHTRWSDEVVKDWRYGTAQRPLRDLVEYWASGYDWILAGKRLAALPHYRAEIDGFGLHFLHFKAQRSGTVRPALMLLNGWPSSFHEYAKLAPMLADPASFGGDADDAFDIVIPALPGFGYSDRPSAPNQVQAVELFHRLMTEGLGYHSFIASGTDIGAGVATRMALKYPQSLRGIHISALTDPPVLPAQGTLHETERTYLRQVQTWRDDEGAYQHLQSTRPQTPAYALNDSPVGLASWILEKFHYWSDAGSDLFSIFPRDMLLDNLNLYWSTQTIASSMRYYYESRNFRPALQVNDRVTVPTAVCMWPKDLVIGPEAWARRFYNVRQYNVQPSGGHFPAWERPDLYANDLRAFDKVLKK